MQTFLEIVKEAVECGASAIFLMAGKRATVKQGGEYKGIADAEALSPSDTERLTRQAYDMVKRPLAEVNDKLDDQFAISISGLTRVCVSAFRQRNSYAMILRIIPFGIPDAAAIGIPKNVMDLADLSEGLVLFTGPAGNGKTTTMACLLDRINRTRSAYILTVENPIEYLFRNDRAFISQREVGLDVKDFETALLATRRQAPDVLLVSEIPDAATMDEVLLAANSHPLVLTAVSAKTAASAVSTLVNTMPAEARSACAKELSRILKAVVSEHLVPDKDGQLKPRFRLLIPDEKIRKAIASQDYYLIG